MSIDNWQHTPLAGREDHLAHGPHSDCIGQDCGWHGEMDRLGRLPLRQRTPHSLPDFTGRP